MKRILSLLLLAALAGALLSGCGGETGGRAYQVYYRNLAAVGGNQTVAAKRLGISRTTLWRYLNPQKAVTGKK